MIQYVFYTPFLSPNPEKMTPSPNLKLLPCIDQLRRQLRHLPTRKPNPDDPTFTVGSRKFARLSLKSTKNISNTLSHPDSPKPYVENIPHNEHPPLVRSPKDISQALKKKFLTDNQLISIYTEKTPFEAMYPPAQYPNNRRTQTPLAQEPASSPSNLFPTMEPLKPEGQTLLVPELTILKHLHPLIRSLHHWTPRHPLIEIPITVEHIHL